MASTTDRKPSPAIRGITPSRPPSSPHTPQRTTSSTFASPSTSYRSEDDAVIIELGSRFLRAGFEGECAPQSYVAFGPRQSRRAGDYRDFLPASANQPNRLRREEEWGSDHELWQMDVRKVDLGLVEDKLHRAIRAAYTKDLLTDPGSQRMIMILPSVMPHQLLEVILTTLFTHFRYHGVMLLQQPTMTVVGAGLRSGLVVDIGWAETIVTGVYEYRECLSSRSVRAMKLMTQEMGKLLYALQEQEPRGYKRKPRSHITLEYCEEVCTKLAWCRGSRSTLNLGLQSLSITDNNIGTSLDDQIPPERLVSVPLSSELASESTKVPLRRLSDPAEEAFFATGTDIFNLDDNEHPIHYLVYNALLALPSDIRGVCMSRIMITGGGSHLPGIEKRLMWELDALVDEHGWDPRRGNAIDVERQKLKERFQNRQSSQKPPEEVESNQSGKDLIEENYRRHQQKETPHVGGTLRLVESLGAWAGASLIAGLRIKGLVDVDRESFLSRGLAGASREPIEVNMGPKRVSFDSGIRKSGELAPWTLGAWA